MINTINAILLVLLYVSVVFVLVMQIQLKNKDIPEVILNLDVKKMYAGMKDNYVDKLFLKDKYANSKDVITDLTTDYMYLFDNMINAIMSNKFTIEKIYKDLLDKEVVRRYPFFLEVLKFSKFVIDYDDYLKRLDVTQLSSLVNEKYPTLRTDERFFIYVPERTSILKLEKIGEAFYRRYPDFLNNCLVNYAC